jgi:hypothetical protein
MAGFQVRSTYSRSLVPASMLTYVHNRRAHNRTSVILCIVICLSRAKCVNGVATMPAPPCSRVTMQLYATLLIIAFGTVGCSARYLRGKSVEVRAPNRLAYSLTLNSHAAVACCATCRCAVGLLFTFWMSLPALLNCVPVGGLSCSSA